MVKESLKIGEINVEVTFKDIKNLHLSVHPPFGKVTVSSPLFYNIDKVKIYVATKLNWIKKEQRKFINQLREQPREFINQETHYFLGTKYLMLIKEGNRNKVVTDGENLLYIQGILPIKLRKKSRSISFIERNCVDTYSVISIFIVKGWELRFRILKYV